VRPNKIKQMWRARAVRHRWLASISTVYAEVMARQGFDTLCIDMQHGMTEMNSLPMLQAISQTDTVRSCGVSRKFSLGPFASMISR